MNYQVNIYNTIGLIEIITKLILYFAILISYKKLN